MSKTIFGKNLLYLFRDKLAPPCEALRSVWLMSMQDLYPEIAFIGVRKLNWLLVMEQQAGLQIRDVAK